MLDTPGIILWSHVLQTVDLQAWEAAETVNYCLTAQSTVLDEAKRWVLLRCWRSVVKLDDCVSEFLVTEHVRSEPHDHGPSRYCAPDGSTTKHGAIKDKETRILPEVIKNFVKCNITKYVHLLQQDTAQGFWRPMLWIHGRIWLLSCGSSHLKKDKDGWLILSYQNINIQILFGRSHSKYVVIALPWLLVAITRPRSRTWGEPYHDGEMGLKIELIVAAQRRDAQVRKDLVSDDRTVEKLTIAVFLVLASNLSRYRLTIAVVSCIHWCI